MATNIIERLFTDEGRGGLITALAEFRTLAGLYEAASQLPEAGELLDVAAGASFIIQGGAETDVFFIVASTAEVI